jgi:branched-chain amino acid transport system permease protein
MRPRARALGVLAVLIVLALFVPHFGGDYYVHIFALVFTNVILAASLRPSLTCGQLNIGHSAFMSIGAYTSALLAKNLAVPFELSLLSGAIRPCGYAACTSRW